MRTNNQLYESIIRDVAKTISKHLRKKIPEANIFFNSNIFQKFNQTTIFNLFYDFFYILEFKNVQNAKIYEYTNELLEPVEFDLTDKNAVNKAARYYNTKKQKDIVYNTKLNDIIENNNQKFLDNDLGNTDILCILPIIEELNIPSYVFFDNFDDFKTLNNYIKYNKNITYVYFGKQENKADNLLYKHNVKYLMWNPYDNKQGINFYIKDFEEPENFI